MVGTSLPNFTKGARQNLEIAPRNTFGGGAGWGSGNLRAPEVGLDEDALITRIYLQALLGGSRNFGWLGPFWFLGLTRAHHRIRDGARRVATRVFCRRICLAPWFMLEHASRAARIFRSPWD